MSNMTAPEADDSPELAAYQQLVTDINVQVGRVKGLYESGQLTPDIATAELCETFLPLLQDLAERAYQTQYANEEFDAAVDEKLWPAGEAEAEGEAAEAEDAPGLWPEDAKIFKMLLTEYRELLGRLDESGATSERVTVINKALARIDELTLEVDDGDEDGAEEPTN